MGDNGDGRDKPMVLVCVPTYDATLHVSLFTSLLSETQAPDSPPFKVCVKTASLLAFACNALWVTALNHRPAVTHCLMIHSDVIPVEPGFIGIMLHHLRQAGADVLSAVMPIKDDKGLTSTALLPDPSCAGWKTDPVRRRRLTLREAEKLPVTFDAHDVATLFNPRSTPDQRESVLDPCLLVNTGLMLVDLSKPWVEQAHFQINDLVYRRPDGRFDADVEPEDWFFSRRAHQLGARVCATRAVKAQHAGRVNYPNHGAWGAWATDVYDEGAGLPPIATSPPLSRERGLSADAPSVRQSPAFVWDKR